MITGRIISKKKNGRPACAVPFLLLIVMLLPSIAWPLQKVILTGKDHEYYLGRDMEFLEDRSGDLSLKDVMASGGWAKSETNIPNFGITRSSLWGRIELENTLPGNAWYFELAYPSIDYVDLYVIGSKGNINEFHTGDRLPFATRNVPHRNYIFKIDPGPGTSMVYMRARTLGAMIIPSTIWSEYGFQSQFFTYIALGLYFGIMLAMFVYNLFLFITLRDRSYLYYILFTACFILYQLTETGFTSQYIFPNYPDLANATTHCVYMALELFGLLFSIQFLSLKNTSPVLYRIFAVLAGLHVPMIFIINLFNHQIKMYIAVPLAFLVLPLILAAGIVALVRGYRPALFFVLAWMSLLVMSMLGNAELSGFLRSDFFITWGIRIGNAAEVLLLSLALAHRIDLMKQDALDKELLYRDSRNRSQRLELELLKKTIQPHFLMNTLTAIRSWLMEEPKKSIRLIDALGEELRPIFNHSGARLITMGEEIAVCRAHLEVMGLRLDRAYSLEVTGIAGDEPIPPLVFHTMIENAFTHGDPEEFSHFSIVRESVPGRTRYIFSLDTPGEDADHGREGTGTRYIRSRLEESFPGRWSLAYGRYEGRWRVIIEILEGIA
jgi:hypothetical protein